MRVCKRCGECCKWVLIGMEGKMDKDQKEYVIQRADKKDGLFYLIRKECHHLKENKCDIYSSRPKLCRVFKGKEHWGAEIFYVPEGCGMK